jgi:hypothetical protein
MKTYWEWFNEETKKDPYPVGVDAEYERSMWHDKHPKPDDVEEDKTFHIWTKEDSEEWIKNYKEILKKV